MVLAADAECVVLARRKNWFGKADTVVALVEGVAGAPPALGLEEGVSIHLLKHFAGRARKALPVPQRMASYDAPADELNAWNKRMNLSTTVNWENWLLANHRRSKEENLVGPIII